MKVFQLSLPETSFHEQCIIIIHTVPFHCFEIDFYDRRSGDASESNKWCFSRAARTKIAVRNGDLVSCTDNGHISHSFCWSSLKTDTSHAVHGVLRNGTREWSTNSIVERSCASKTKQKNNDN